MKLFYLSSGAREWILEHVLAAGHDVMGVYTTDPARWPKVVPTIELAGSRGIPHRILRRADLENPPVELEGQVCLSAGFGLILPRAFIQHISTCLNVHGTLLPRYRGNRTSNWALVKGETMSGVTVHVVDEGIDTGPVVLQRAFRLSPFETAASLARKIAAFEPGVVTEALRLFEEHGTACLRPQVSDAAAENLPDRKPEHSRIDPQRPLIDLVNEIRAADPDRFPAFFMLHGEKVCIRLWRPDKPTGEDDLL